MRLSINPDQLDSDRDSVGNVCDNCPNKKNTNQFDDDSDGIGNYCDNCPNHQNADQRDVDEDGIGDVCDVEECDGWDNDGDNLVDEGFDMDSDGIADCFDNCPTMYNPDQYDEDRDGIGDVCEDFPCAGFKMQMDDIVYCQKGNNYPTLRPQVYHRLWIKSNQA